MTTEYHECSERVWSGWHKYPCRIHATIQRNGLWYCKKHDPEYIKAKREKEHNKYLSEMEIATKKSIRNRIINAITDEIPTEKLERHADVIRKFIQDLS